MTNPDYNSTSELRETLNGFQDSRNNMAAKRFRRRALSPLSEFNKDDIPFDRLRSATFHRCKFVTRPLDPGKPTIDEWKNFNSKLRSISGELVKKCEDALGPYLGLMWFQAKICDLNRTLKINETKRQDVLAWHIVCGSTISYEEAPHLDLPKPFSIEDTLQTLLLELEEKERCMKYLDQRLPGISKR